MSKPGNDGLARPFLNPTFSFMFFLTREKGSPKTALRIKNGVKFAKNGGKGDMLIKSEENID